MATNKELLEKLDKIDDEELAHMLALVAYRESQEELDQLIQSEEYTPPDEIQMRTFQEKFHKDSQRALHRSKSRVIRWVCGIAAAAVFVFAVPISADNTTIFELVAQVFTDYSDISSLDGYTFEKPDDWDCEYYPTWIPQEFSFDKIISLDYSQSIYFKSKTNASLSFSFTRNWLFDYCATEEGLYFNGTITLYGKDAPIYFSKSGKRKIICISTNQGTIVIDGELSETNLVEIAKNIANLG